MEVDVDDDAEVEDMRETRRRGAGRPGRDVETIQGVSMVSQRWLQVSDSQ